MDASTTSKDGVNNWAGYDAVNRYGDEVLTGGNDYSTSSPQNYPALGRIYRTGYEEKYIVDYNTNNLKSNLGLYYMLSDKIELNYNFNYSTGTTVYQGDNRYSLKNINFFQNKIEIKQNDKFFVRVYATNEDAGDTYDAVVTAFEMSEASKPEGVFYQNYAQYYTGIKARIFAAGMPTNDENKPNLSEIIAECGCSFEEAQQIFAQEFLIWQSNTRALQNEWAYGDGVDSMSVFSRESRNAAENLVSGGSQNPYYRPGTERYDSLLNVVTTALLSEGGSRLYDKSALYNIDAQYQFTLWEEWDFTAGGNSRIYTPDSKGTIFIDTADSKITNWNIGAYIGANYKLLNDRLILDATVRIDKNENFDPVVSPAISAVYSHSPDHTFRMTFSTAVRNPTLADQYLYYNVGRAILLGNLNGYDSLVTVESFNNYRNGNIFNPSLLDYFNVDPIRPERVQTIEFGYRGMINKKFYVDASYYHSWYSYFIGYVIGVDLTYSPVNNQPINVQPYRISANATDQVTTQGVNIGANYYLGNNWVINANYSWNKLNLQGSDDPIIPAYNTPENKFNVGVNGRDFTLFGARNFGFGVNFKWIEGFEFEGSPQFTGFVDTYYMIDAQVNYRWVKTNLTFKLGSSNITNNQVYQVYGGPQVGRLAYFSISYDWLNR